MAHGAVVSVLSLTGSGRLCDMESNEGIQSRDIHVGKASNTQSRGGKGVCVAVVANRQSVMLVVDTDMPTLSHLERWYVSTARGVRCFYQSMFSNVARP